MSIEETPDEIVLMILDYFPYKLPILLRLVCHRWNVLLGDQRKNSSMDVSLMLGARFGMEGAMFKWLCTVDCTLTLNLLGSILQKNDTDTLKSFRQRGIVSVHSYMHIIGGYAEPTLLRNEIASIFLDGDGFEFIFILQGAIRSRRKHSIRLLFKSKRLSPVKFTHKLFDFATDTSHDANFYKWCINKFGGYVEWKVMVAKIIMWDLFELIDGVFDGIDENQFRFVANIMIEHNRLSMLGMLIDHVNGNYDPCPDGIDCIDETSCLYRRAVEHNRMKALKKFNPIDSRTYCVGAIEAAVNTENSVLLCWLIENNFPISGNAIIDAEKKGGMVNDILQNCLDKDKGEAYAIYYTA